DLDRARAALAGLAVPAQREVVGVLGLDPVQHVEHDHPGIDVDVELGEVPALDVAAPDLEHSLCHRVLLAYVKAYFTSSPTLPDSRSSILALAIATRCAGPSGRCRFSTSMPPAAFLMM